MNVLVFKDIKNNRWTLWSADRKTHIGYRKSLALKNCKFVVLDDKRVKVVKTGKRFPHAWVIGTLTLSHQASKCSKLIAYNPFIHKSFMCGSRPVISAKEVYFDSKGRLFAK